MMRLLQSIDFIEDVSLKRESLFRWRLEKSKQTRNLYQCDRCRRLVTTYNAHPMPDCNCAPCRVCKKPIGGKNHTSPSVPATGYNPYLNIAGALGSLTLGYHTTQVVTEKPASRPAKHSLLSAGAPQ